MSGTITISSGARRVRIAARHAIYRTTIENAFDHFYGAVEPCDGVVDYSLPAEHRVRGFDAFPVFFPSLADPFETVRQYLEFAGIEPGQLVFDLGGYSGLTAIAFAQAGARVVVLEPDPENHRACERNLAEFARRCGVCDVVLLEAAVAGERGIMRFSAEGATGSAMSAIIGERGGRIVEVECVTLDDLVERYGAPNFVKMDIEGAELDLVRQAEAFFRAHHPRMILEAHPFAGKNAEAELCRRLTEYGYDCRVLSQTGHFFNLITATPRP